MNPFSILKMRNIAVGGKPMVSGKMVITANDGGAYVSGQEMKLLEAGTGNNVLRKASASSGTASASTTNSGWSAATPFGLDYTNNGWITSAGNTTGWLQWASTTTIDVVMVSITGRIGGQTQSPKNFTIDYSDDASAWTTAKTVTGSTAWGDGEIRSWTWSSVGAHTYWRMNITLNDGDASRCGLSTFMLGCANGEAISSNTYNGTVTATSAFDGLSTPPKLIDGAGTGATEGWTSTAGTTATIFWAAPKQYTVNTMKWTSRPSEGPRSPKDFTIQFTTDYSAYSTVDTVTGSTGWGSSEERTFSIS